MYTNSMEANQSESLRVKERSHDVLEGNALDPTARAVDAAILVLIVLNVLAVILETVPSLAQRYAVWFHWFEIISVAIFTAEYLVRLWAATSNPRFHHPVWGRLRWMVTPLALVDLVAILPFYLPFVFQIDLRFMRALRLIRLLRIFKIRRYSQALDIVLIAFRTTRNDLLLAVAAIWLLLVIASALLYFVERGSGLEEFSSIPRTMAWMIALLTPNIGVSVDPPSLPGRVIGTLIAILGFGVWALPAGILATGIGQAMRQKEREEEKCPHCGRSRSQPSEADAESSSSNSV